MATDKELFEALKLHELTFVTGVPCSIFKDFLVYMNSHEEEILHVRATSEGEAVGIAAGYHLATGKVPVIYMQNSGLGNAVNPLTSLVDKEVYSIPALLFVSWRGEPGKKDEPQHKKMGRILSDFLSVLEIPYEIAEEDIEDLKEQIETLKKTAVREGKSVALIFKEGMITKS